jgi:hypothetical protein
MAALTVGGEHPKASAILLPEPFGRQIPKLCDAPRVPSPPMSSDIRN